MTTAQRKATWCRSCRQPAELAALVRVVPVDGSAPYYVHRPTGEGRECFASTPRRSVARIEATEPNRERSVP